MFFLHISIYRQLGCFPLSATVNSTDVNRNKESSLKPCSRIYFILLPLPSITLQDLEILHHVHSLIH